MQACSKPGLRAALGLSLWLVTAAFGQERESRPLIRWEGRTMGSPYTIQIVGTNLPDAQGRRFSHLLDPRTGRPVQHALAGVTVVAPNSMTADALGTTLFVLGLEEGRRLIEAQPAAAALFIVREAEGRFRQIRSAAWDRLTGDRP